MARAPGTPPQLDGYEPVRLLGSGGYADVFLYQEQSPHRAVAVKVLVREAIKKGGADFSREANVMAQVSEHPYIVQVFGAGIAGDGRPYIVMEYYPGADFYDRARNEQMLVPEVLRTGVQLASAVETAHAAGILHRDIKPANILTSKYNKPALTDFGIATADLPGSDTTDAISIPWAPREAFSGAEPTVRGDVYSLAATVYTLLAGRSPFLIPGGDNRELALIARIEGTPLLPTGRPDVPSALERVLAGAMAKDAEHRPISAAEFGRQLQAVESQMRLAVTPLELEHEPQAARPRQTAPDDDSTRVKGVTQVDAQSEPQPDGLISGIGAPAGSNQPVDRTRQGVLAEPAVSDTKAIDRSSSVVELPDAPPRSPNAKYAIAAACALLLAVVGGLAFVLSQPDDDPSVEPADEAEVNDGLDQAVVPPPPAVRQLSGTANADGTFTFEWDAPGEGLLYAVTEDGAPIAAPTSETTVTAATQCIQVESIAENGVLSAPTRGCA